MKNVYVIGDLHQDFKPVRALARQLGLEGVPATYNRENVLICLGDFGANFSFDYRDRNFKDKMGKYNFTYFVIRGNHEERPSICADGSPSEWDTEFYFGSLVYVEKKYPYIKYALDCPNVYEILGKRAFVIPGAYSVDKYFRLERNMTWFPQEQLTEDEMKLGKQWVNLRNDYDIVLTHTCPLLYEPTDLFLSCIDQSMVDNTMERYLGEIERSINYRLWCFGHFHATRVYPKYDEQQMLMLFNEEYLNLTEYLENNDIHKSLYKIEN